MIRHILSSVCTITALSASAQTDPAASASNNQPRIWSALSGERIQVDGDVLRLRDVTCAKPTTDAGRNAKALLNTFLRAGHVRCLVSETGLAECTVNGQNINARLRQQPGCGPSDPSAKSLRPDVNPPFRSAATPRQIERRIRPADPLQLWRRATGLGPIPDHLQLVLYSLQLYLNTQTGGMPDPAGRQQDQ